MKRRIILTVQDWIEWLQQDPRWWIFTPKQQTLLIEQAIEYTPVEMQVEEFIDYILIQDTTPTKYRRYSNPCPSDEYSEEVLEEIGKQCETNPSDYRKTLAMVSPDRNPGCPSRALDKFYYLENTCDSLSYTPLDHMLQITNFISMYWNTTKIYFDTFFEENKDKKCNFDLDHSLNPTRYNQYRQAMFDEIHRMKQYSDLQPDEQKYIQMLEYYKDIHYISFDVFYEQLEHSAQNLRERILKTKEQNPNTVTILRLAYQVEKSSLWVAMLVYHLIYDVIDGVEFNHTINILPYEELARKRISNIILVYPDDCIYSGQQLLTTLQADANLLKKYTQLISCFSLCPFVRDRFVMLTQTPSFWKDHFKFIDTPITIDFGETQLISSLPYEAQITGWLSRFGIIPYILRIPTNVYFQHKLADDLSTMTRILTYGILPIERKDKTSLRIGDTLWIGNMINNCPDIQHGLHQDFESESLRCPPSCYKKIVYTWKNQPIRPKAYLGDVFGNIMV